MDLRLTAELPARGLSVTLGVPAGRTLALIGPNGSGKSSVLGVIAGLLPADEGTADLGGRRLFHAGREPFRAVHLPPHERGVALLSQQPALFPHLRVRDNVAFGPRSRGAGGDRAREQADRWLAELGATDLASRRPSSLSGGEAQRVALARALAAEPDLLLLDEPLSALDVSVAAVIRQVLRQVLRGRTAVVVTHDVLDVVLLADRIAVLDAGRVVEEGPTAEVMRRPRSPFAAGFCGLNMLTGTSTGTDRLTTATGQVVVGVADPGLPQGLPAVAVFRPSAVAVHLGIPQGSPRNVLPAVVDQLEPQGHLVRVRAGALGADITPSSVAELGLAPGTQVHLAVKAAEVSLYPA